MSGLGQGFLAGFNSGNQFFANQQASERADKRLAMDQERLGIQQAQDQRAQEAHGLNMELNQANLWKQQRANSKSYVTDWVNIAASGKDVPNVTYELIGHMNNMGMDISSLLPEENAKYMTTAQQLIDDKISYQSPEAVALAKSIYEKELNADLQAKGISGRREVTGIVPTPNGTLALEINRYDGDGNLVSKAAPVTDGGQVQGNDNVVMFNPEKAMKRLLGRSALSREILEKNPELLNAWKSTIQTLRTNRKDGYSGLITDERSGMVYQKNLRTGEIQVLQEGDKDIMKHSLGIGIGGGGSDKGYDIKNFDGVQYRVNKDNGTTDIYDRNLNQWTTITGANESVKLSPAMARNILAESEMIELSNAEKMTYKTKEEQAAYKQYKVAQAMFPGTNIGDQVAAQIGFKQKDIVTPIKSYKDAVSTIEASRAKLVAQNPQLKGQPEWKLNKLLFEKYGTALQKSLPGIEKYKDRLTKDSAQQPNESKMPSKEVVLNSLERFKSMAATTEIKADNKVKAKLARIGQLEQQLKSKPEKPSGSGLGMGFTVSQATNNQEHKALKELHGLLAEMGAI